MRPGYFIILLYLAPDDFTHQRKALTLNGLTHIMQQASNVPQCPHFITLLSNAR
jgi:hypothetical protein